MNASRACVWAAIAAGAVCSVAAPVRGDWDPNDPAKWVQLPDLTTGGYDVKATGPIMLADDFVCTQTDYITDVHLWGSWLNNIKPADMNQVSFTLGLWSDVPAAENSPSHPGSLLWSTITSGAARVYASGTTETFIDPTGQVLGTDQEVWQYNFVNFANPYLQQGTIANPVIYWLSVQVETPTGVFGWKSAVPPHQLDDAAYKTDANAAWVDLHYPVTNGASMDLAFVITPEPGTLALLGLGVAALCVRRRR